MFLGQNQGVKGPIHFDLYNWKTLHIQRHFFYEHIFVYPSNPNCPNHPPSPIYHQISHDYLIKECLNTPHVPKNLNHMSQHPPPSQSHYLWQTSHSHYPPPPQIRKSNRLTKPHTYLQDYNCELTKGSNPSTNYTSTSKVLYPIQHVFLF